jgi:hypothetical protein
VSDSNEITPSKLLENNLKIKEKVSLLLSQVCINYLVAICIMSQFALSVQSHSILMILFADGFRPSTRGTRKALDLISTPFCFLLTDDPPKPENTDTVENNGDKRGVVTLDHFSPKGIILILSIQQHCNNPI